MTINVSRTIAALGLAALVMMPGRRVDLEISHSNDQFDPNHDYTTELVDALKEGNVSQRQSRVRDVLDRYICSLPETLVLKEADGYVDPINPQTVVLEYGQYPLMPLELLFGMMSEEGDGPLQDAFLVYTLGALGLKPSQPGMETTVIMTCNEE